MPEYAPIILILLLVIGGRVLKWYVEKQQAEKRAAEGRGPRTSRQPAAKPPAGRQPASYGRSGESRLETAAEKPALPGQTIAPPRPGGGSRPTPAAPRRQEPPGAAVARRAIRQKTQRRGAGAPAARSRVAPAPAEEEPEGASVGQLARHLASRGTDEVSGLRARTLPAAERPAPPPSAAPEPAAGFLGTMLRGRNLARAVALSEILGPPKGLRDL